MTSKHGRLGVWAYSTARTAAESSDSHAIAAERLYKELLEHPDPDMIYFMFQQACHQMIQDVVTDEDDPADASFNYDDEDELAA